MDHSEVYCANWRRRLSKTRQREEGREREIVSYVTVQVEYLVAIVHSNRLAPDKPHLEPADQEDEIGQPER